ncbi:MAG: DUF2934 domain-containing protein [Chromatiales bacterium]|nr:DUF2934 domain-containing protein [Chromatiales bacterium]
MPGSTSRPAGNAPAPAARPSPGAGQQGNGFARLTAGERHELIAALARHLARERGLVPGHELDDWLAAEKTIDATFI